MLRRHRNESNAHKLLKQKAASDLIDKGYDVFVEYRVHLPKLYIVDVAGFKTNHSVAIECGKVCFHKLEALRGHFSEVTRYHYNASINARRETKLLRGRAEGATATRKISSGGRIQIPPEIRMVLDIKDGDTAYWVEDKDGQIVLRKAHLR